MSGQIQSRVLGPTATVTVEDGPEVKERETVERALALLTPGLVDPLLELT